MLSIALSQCSAQTLLVWTQTSQLAPLYETSTASWWEFEFFSMKF